MSNKHAIDVALDMLATYYQTIPGCSREAVTPARRELATLLLDKEALTRICQILKAESMGNITKWTALTAIRDAIKQGQNALHD